MKQGFTLIELLVVVLIIGILSAVALPQYTTAVEKARSSEALTLMSSIRNAAERYRLQKDEWPTSFNMLDVEIPKVPGSSSYGGKNFTLTMGAPNGTTGSTFVVVASRNMTKNKYALKTVLTEDATTGTINAVRCCGMSTSLNTSCGMAMTAGVAKYCSAITSGKNSDF